MTYPHAWRSHVLQALAFAMVTSLALPTNADQQAVLTVVEDRGGASALLYYCLLYTSPSPRDLSTSRMPSSA